MVRSPDADVIEQVEVPRELWDEWIEDDGTPPQRRIVELMVKEVSASDDHDLGEIDGQLGGDPDGISIEIDHGTARFRPQQPDGPVTITIRDAH